MTGRKTDRLPLAWDDLRTALFLARDGSVRSAARALGVSHSTVLRRIAALERAAGARLFERSPAGVELTPAGQDVFDTSKEVEELVVGLERRVTGSDVRLSGAIRVTLPDPFLPALMPELGAFGCAYPDIELVLDVGTRYADLAHREADVAIRIAAEPPPDLVGRRIGQASVGVYGTKGYLTGRDTKNLGKLDWIHWEADSSMVFERWMRQHVPDARVALRVTSGWALRDAVEAGLGVTVIPSALGAALRDAKRVRVVRELAAPLWILTHRDLRTTARVRVFRDFMAEAIAKKSWF
jgi:DNA-binding transcriptional LysR family regulator